MPTPTRAPQLRNLRLALAIVPAAFALLSLFGLAVSVHAEGVTFSGDHPDKSIDVNIDDAPVATVLQSLHDKYGIEIGGLDESDPGDAITLTMSGSLPNILERILRNRNYMIVRSQKNVTGVEKILLAGSTPDTPKADAAPAPKRSKANDEAP